MSLAGRLSPTLLETNYAIICPCVNWMSLPASSIVLQPSFGKSSVSYMQFISHVVDVFSGFTTLLSQPLLMYSRTLWNVAVCSVSNIHNGGWVGFVTHYLATRSAFFPVVCAFLQTSHRFSSLTVSSLGFRPWSDAPGTVSSVQVGGAGPCHD